MRVLKAKGKPGAATVYRCHSVTEPTVGLSYADLGLLLKQFGVDHALALELWKTGLHDARPAAGQRTELSPRPRRSGPERTRAGRRS